MVLYLIRHAKAGDRDPREPDDRARPLTDEGEAQARAIADLLAPLPPVALVSSPYMRCRQTLAPLSARTGLPIRDDDRLAEDSPFTLAISLLEESDEGTILCSHGDVIPATIDALIRRGMLLESGVRAVRKGAMFELHRDGTRFARARYIEAP